MPQRLTPMMPYNLNTQNIRLSNIAYRLGILDVPPKYHKSTIPGANGMAI